MYDKTIVRNDIPYDILYRFNKSTFQNKDGTIKKKY